ANDIALTLHHGGEAGPGDPCRIVLFFLSNLGIEHVGTFEELSFSCARHQACDRYVSVLQFIPQREREGIEKRLGAAVDRLERARHKAGDGASDEDAALAASTHLAPHFLNQKASSNLLTNVGETALLYLHPSRDGASFIPVLALAFPGILWTRMVRESTG